MRGQAFMIAGLAAAAVLTAASGTSAQQMIAATPARATLVSAVGHPPNRSNRAVFVDEFGRTVVVTNAHGRSFHGHGFHGHQSMHHHGQPLSAQQHIRRSQNRIEAHARSIAHGNQGVRHPHQHQR